MVSLLNSQGMKSCKSRESFCLSILTIYTNDWSTFWHIYWCHIYFSFCGIPSQEQAGSSWLEFYGSGLASLPSWLEMVNAGWLGSIRSEIFLQMKFIIFQGCPIKQAVFSPGQPTPYNQLLIQPLLLVPECCFAENFEARVSFSSFGYQFELIFASYSVPWVFNIYIIWHLEIKM